MDSAPQQADMSRAGLAGAKSVAKHTILANPKATAWLIAILVVAIVVVSYMLYKRKKEGYTTNYMTGSNQNQAIATGGSILDHTGAVDGRTARMITWTDINGVSHTAAEAQSAPFDSQGRLVGKSVGDLADLRVGGVMGDDVNSVTNFTDILATGESISAMDAKIGSMCAPASSRAAEDLQAQHALNGGLSGGARTPQ